MLSFDQIVGLFLDFIDYVVILYASFFILIFFITCKLVGWTKVDIHKKYLSRGIFCNVYIKCAKYITNWFDVLRSCPAVLGHWGTVFVTYG